MAAMAFKNEDLSDVRGRWVGTEKQMACVFKALIHAYNRNKELILSCKLLKHRCRKEAQGLFV
jgi:hypothetical protein